MKSIIALIGTVLCQYALAADPARWQIDYPASRLGFTAQQAGAEFRGHFGSFTADVRFDPEALEQSSASVSIEMVSVDSADRERDEILRGPDWFDVEHYPNARFSARRFEKSAAGFTAYGELTIRDVPVPVAFEFVVDRRGGDIVLNGVATLDRFAFDLGLGDWADTEWVGATVRVDVVLTAMP